MSETVTMTLTVTTAKSMAYSAMAVLGQAQRAVTQQAHNAGEPTPPSSLYVYDSLGEEDEDETDAADAEDPAPSRPTEDEGVAEPDAEVIECPVEPVKFRGPSEWFPLEPFWRLTVPKK